MFECKELLPAKSHQELMESTGIYLAADKHHHRSIKVPGKHFSLNLLFGTLTFGDFLVFLLVLFYFNSTQAHLSSSRSKAHQDALPTPSIQFHQQFFQENYGDSFSAGLSTDTRQPTPPLTINLNKLDWEQNDKEPWLSHQHKSSQLSSISPSRVMRLHSQDFPNFDPIDPGNNLYTPIFHFNPKYDYSQTVAAKKVTRDTQLGVQNPNQDPNLDQIEQGSGGYSNQLFDDTTEVSSDLTGINRESNLENSIFPNRMFTPTYPESTATPFTEPNFQNKPPVLNRRLPKLSVTAGKFWRHFIPYDTFIDEEGDLRQLNSTIMIKNPHFHNTKSAISISSSNQPVVIGDYFSWIQYDQGSKLLYGFPTEDDAGLHQLVLLVKDSYGAFSEEPIEIYVRQHQSSRAFSHRFMLDRVIWDLHSFPSMVDALGEFIRRLTNRVYSDKPLDNVVVQYYRVDDMNVSQSNSNSSPNDGVVLSETSFSVAWSNESLPIHPCNVTKIGELFKILIDIQEPNSIFMTTLNQVNTFSPSRNLLRQVGTEFQPSRVKLQLTGACGIGDINDSTNQGVEAITELKVKNKIGKLNVRLGDMIEYKIPSDTFEVDIEMLEVNLHTIDGYVLEEDSRYNFLDFDQDSKILYGIPYDYLNHAGQKELQLTAVHNKTRRKVREVFVLNIEPYDLTSINNRAFKVSLYLIARTMEFGPRERVFLTRRMAQAIKISDQGAKPLMSDTELIVTEVQRFVSSVSLNSPYASLSTNNITKLPDEKRDSTYQESYDITGRMSGQDNYLYKFTWTNGTIGHRGDCPVEVIQKNILDALLECMMRLEVPVVEDFTKNDSARFFDRLHFFFEPDYDLVHLRFEPLGTCFKELEPHNVGNNDLADIVDRATDEPTEPELESWTSSYLPATTMKPQPDANEDEYWSIVVLIILVVALIFVIIMFFMGMHTYRMNQDKKFELQVRLAQARQNSMYLSSMMLENQAAGDHGLRGQLISTLVGKQDHNDEERMSRKPVILDSEKDYLNKRQISKITTVQMNGNGVQTLPLKPNTTFTLDSIAGTMRSMAGSVGHSSSVMTNLDDKRSMTLHRRPSGQEQRLMNQQSSLYNLNQPLIPMIAPIAMLPQNQTCFPYGQVPIVRTVMPDPSFFTLKPGQNQLFYRPPLPIVMGSPNLTPTHMIRDESSMNTRCMHDGYSTNNKLLDSNQSSSKTCSSSPSATAQSIISNSNFLLDDRNIGHGI